MRPRRPRFPNTAIRGGISWLVFFLLQQRLCSLFKLLKKEIFVPPIWIIFFEKLSRRKMSFLLSVNSHICNSILDAFERHFSRVYLRFKNVFLTHLQGILIPLRKWLAERCVALYKQQHGTLYSLLASV